MSRRPTPQELLAIGENAARVAHKAMVAAMAPAAPASDAPKRFAATTPIEIFTPGEWAGLSWTDEDLDEMVRNFHALAAYVKPPIKLGHDDGQVLAQVDGYPAIGHVENLRRVGNRLVADVSDMPSIVRNAIDKRLYRRVSAEIYPSWETTSAAKSLKSDVQGKVLAAVALLGADVPEVKSLDDLQRYLASELGRVVTLTESPCDPLAVSCCCDGGASPAASKGAIVNDSAEMVKLDEHAKVLAQREGLDWNELNDRKVARLKAVREMSEAERRVDFGGFDPSVAADVGTLAHTCMDATEAVLQEMGWSRTDETLRRKAMQLAIAIRPYIDPGPVDKERIVKNYATGAADFPSEAKGLLSEEQAALGAIAAKLRGLQGDARRAAYARLTEDERELVRLHESPTERAGVATYGLERWRALKGVAAKYDLDLSRRYARGQAEVVLFREQPQFRPTVKDAPSWHLAMLAMEADQRVQFDENPGARRDCALLLMKARPDLAPEYQPDVRKVLRDEAEERWRGSESERNLVARMREHVARLGITPPDDHSSDEERRAYRVACERFLREHKVELKEVYREQSR
jgi:hypothetical protein